LQLSWKYATEGFAFKEDMLCKEGFAVKEDLLYKEGFAVK
jgi:hypothetical protein